jgi:carbonic anhydrase
MTGTGLLIARGLVPDMQLEFNVRDFHFNTPSEHTINGERFAMEMQIVHSIVPDYLPNDLSLVGRKLVISILFAVKPGANNTFLNRLNLQTLDTTTGLDLGEWLRSMQPSYVFYEGSLTTPPCTENVYQFVMTQVQEMSSDQLQSFTDFYASNCRGAQKINNRRVVKVTKRISRNLDSFALSNVSLSSLFLFSLLLLLTFLI